MTLRPIWIARRNSRVHALLPSSMTACGLAVPPSPHKPQVPAPLNAGIRHVFCVNCLAAVRAGRQVAPWVPSDVEDLTTRIGGPCL